MTSCALWHELAICNSKDDGYGCWILSDVNKIHHFVFFSERSSTKNIDTKVFLKYVEWIFQPKQI